MGAARKFDLDHRLEDYFATLRSTPAREVLKRHACNWQMYAAVTGSALAMVTNASAQIIGSGIQDIAADPIASARIAQHFLANSQNLAVRNVIRLAMATGNSGKIALSSQTQAPSISPGGVVPLYSTSSIIQPGELVSIFGTNLASGIANWNGNFPTSLGGSSVEINGKAAFLIYVSPTQINLQAPDDTTTGPVPVVVKTGAGSATSTVTLSPFAPAFNLLDAKYVTGIILRRNGSGAYGGGTYDLLGPTGKSFGYPTRAAVPGDTVELFAVGLGPTTPAIPAGELFTGAAPVNNPIHLYLNNVRVTPTFVGLSSAGIYQINLNVPSGLGQGDVPIVAIAGGIETQMGVKFSLEVCPNTNLVTGGCSSGSIFVGGGTGIGPGGSGFGTGGGTLGPTGGTPRGGSGGGTGGGGGSGGGSGGSGALRRGTNPYQPRLRFEPRVEQALPPANRFFPDGGSEG